MLFASSGENTMAIRLDGRTGDLTKSHVLWTNKKASAYVPSPVAYQGLVYVAGDKGIATCLSAADGKQVWKERLGETYHASPVAGDGKVYFTSKEGVIRVIRAGSKFELLSENDMGETIVASPAISERHIFLRGEKHLFCIGE
jgi:hypothetical protein